MISFNIRMYYTFAMPLPAGWFIVVGLATCLSAGPDVAAVTLSSLGGGPVVV